MTYACSNCGKTVGRGHLVSHAKNRVNTVRKPNLHKATIMVSGKKVKALLCTKCLRKADRPHKQKKDIQLRIEKKESGEKDQVKGKDK